MNHIATSQTRAALAVRGILSSQIFLTLLGFAAMVLAANPNFVIPLKPVPLTFQLLVVLVIGFTMPRRAVLATVLLYLAAAFAFRQPITAQNPWVTGGYLCGYVIAAVGISAMWSWGHAQARWTRVAMALLCSAFGIVIVHVLGLMWGHVAMGGLSNPDQTWYVTFMGFTAPFVKFDICKGLLAAVLAVGVSRRRFAD